MVFRKPKPITAAQKLADIKSTTQHWANVTQLDTRAVQGSDGMTRYQRTGWPLAGNELFVAEPIARVKVAA